MKTRKELLAKYSPKLSAACDAEMSTKEKLAASSPQLTPMNSVALIREDLEITVTLGQHPRTPRSEARPMGLRIKFGPEDFSWLNEKEMKLLAHLITTGSTEGHK